MTEKERMFAGKLYHPRRITENQWNVIRPACKKFNESEFWQNHHALEELKCYFAKAEDDMVLTPPILLLSWR